MEVNAASVALIDRERVLLIQRAFEPLKGLWSLPGGRREAGESIEETAIREVREEVGLEVFALRPIMVMAVAGFRLQIFATQGFEGEIVSSPEILAHGWVRPDRLGNLPTTPRLDEVLERAMMLFDRR